MANALALAILLLSWVVPDHFPPWTAFHTEVPAFVAAVIGVGGNWRRGGEAVKLPFGVFVLLLLVLTAVFQWLTFQLTFFGDLLVVIAYIGTIACAWVWGYQWQKRESQGAVLEPLCYLLIFASLISTFQLLSQWLQVEWAMNDWVLEGLRNGRPRANVGQPNQAATLLLMGSVAAGVLLYREKIEQVTAWAALVFFALGLTLTQSRTALLSAFIVAVAYHAVSDPLRPVALSRRGVWFWFAVLLIAALSFPFWNWGAGVSALGLDQMASTGTRPIIWRQLVAALLQHPWVGWGWLQVAQALQVGALTFPGTEQTNYSHNIILDLMLFVGIPIGCLVIALAGRWIWNRAHRSKDGMIVTCCFLLLIPLAIHAQLELPHTYAYFLVIAAVLLGVVDANAEDSKVITVQIPKWLLPAFLCSWIPFLFGLGYEYSTVEEDFRINRFENRRIGVTPSGYEVPELHLLTQMGGLLHVMRLRAAPGMPAEDVELLLKIAKRYTWAPIQFRAALALGLNGRPIEASERLEVIKTLFNADIYAEACDNFRQLRAEKYPELWLVSIP
jgi:O-antigen ligase